MDSVWLINIGHVGCILDVFETESISSKGSSMDGKFLLSLSAHSSERPCLELGIFCDVRIPWSSPTELRPWWNRPLKQECKGEVLWYKVHQKLKPQQAFSLLNST